MEICAVQKRKIIKNLVTRCQNFKAKMHQFELAYSAPQTHWLDLRDRLLRGGRGREEDCAVLKIRYYVP